MGKNSALLTATNAHELLVGKRLLEQGEIIAFPTETVYGLGANAYDFKAISKVYTLKNRPLHNPLIVHYSSLERAQKDVTFTDQAFLLGKKFWPGPLTLILQKKSSSLIAENCHRAYPTEVAVRVPSHKVAQQLLTNVDFPLGAPSANPSGCISPTWAHHVAHHFPHIHILQGGACSVGVESTVVYCSLEKISLVRPGLITAQDISQALKIPVDMWSQEHTGPSPGLTLRHYAPKKPLLINTTTFDPQKDGVLWFGPFDRDFSLHNPSEKHNFFSNQFFNLSPSKDLLEAARNLFQGLYVLDQGPCERIISAPIPLEGIGFALNDRLKRACAL